LSNCFIIAVLKN